MQVFQGKEALREYINKQRNKGLSIGFVPTMGALHDGHLSLIDAAKKENDLVVCSIFVNPTQFNNPEDFSKYPSTLAADKALLQGKKCDVLFMPDTKEMYGSQAASKSYSFGEVENVMEGAFRPGHFDGVATIVSKLFDSAFPDRAYFGEKDYEQLCIIQSLVEQEKLPIQIVPVAIMREESGLAMSSRNVRLSKTGRKQAAFIYEIEQEAVQMRANGASPSHIETNLRNAFEQRKEFTLEYVSIANSKNLQPIDAFSNTVPTRIFIAAEIEGVRLIDNHPLD